MYIVVMTIPVPHTKKKAYKKWTENSAEILQRYGCLRVEEVWGDWIPKGNFTDFNKAVQANSEESIVVQWQYWPSKNALLEAEERMKEENAFAVESDVPFEGKRLIVGGFKPFFTKRTDY